MNAEGGKSCSVLRLSTGGAAGEDAFGAKAALGGVCTGNPGDFLGGGETFATVSATGTSVKGKASGLSTSTTSLNSGGGGMNKGRGGGDWEADDGGPEVSEPVSEAWVPAGEELDPEVSAELVELRGLQQRRTKLDKGRIKREYASQ